MTSLGDLELTNAISVFTTWSLCSCSGKEIKCLFLNRADGYVGPNIIKTCTAASHSRTTAASAVILCLFCRQETPREELTGKGEQNTLVDDYH